MKRLTLLWVLLSMMGCSPTITTSIMPNVRMSDYKSAYVKSIQEDEFNICSKIMLQLANMGYKVMDKDKPDNPVSSDMIVSYNFHGDWDFGYYLQAFQVRFSNALTNQLLGTIDFNRHGNFGYGPDERIADAFNDFKSKSR